MPYGPKPRDITGEKFNKLLVVKFSHKIGEKRFFICKCDCGKETISRIDSILSGHKKSCGCLIYEHCKSGNARRTHGLRHIPEYNSWCLLRSRCNNTKNYKYDSYGGRGIKVCKRWHNFANFVADMGLKPSKIHSIDRINNDGNYEPKNCRWATPKQQSNNRRKPKKYIHSANSLANLEKWRNRFKH